MLINIYQSAIRKRIEEITGKERQERLYTTEVQAARQLFCIARIEEQTIKVMIDSGASGNFIDPEVAAARDISTRQKKKLYKLGLADSENALYNNG